MMRRLPTWLVDMVWIVGLISFAVLLRTVYGGPAGILSDHDSAGYIVRAREIFSGGSVFDALVVPGYPLLIGLWAKIVGNDILAARVASIASGAAVTAVAYLLGNRFWGRAVGVTAGVLIALNVALIDVSVSEYSESTYVLVTFLALAVTMWAASSGSLGLWLLAGIVAGLCYWVRPEGVVYLMLLPFLGLCHSLWKQRRLSRRTALNLAVFVVAGSLLVLPNVLFIHNEMGVWSINGRTALAALIHGEAQQDPLYYERAVGQLTPDRLSTMQDDGLQHVSMTESVRSNPVFKLKEMIRNWEKTYRLLPSVFPLTLVLFVGTLLVGAWTFGSGWPVLFLAGAMTPWIFVYPLYEIDFENLAPIVPILTMGAAIGLVSVARRLSEASEGRIQRFSAARSSTVFLVALVFLAHFPEALTYLQTVRNPDQLAQGREDHPINREAGAWVDRNLPSQARLMARKGFIPLYGNRRDTELPFAEYEDVIYHARATGIEYLVMEESLRWARPQLDALFETPTEFRELELVYSNESVPGRGVLIFRIRSEDEATALP
jgi:hypothetical protein